MFRYSAKSLKNGWEEFCPSELVLKDKSGDWRTLSGDVKVALSVQIVKEKGCSNAFRVGPDHNSYKATGYCGLAKNDAYGLGYLNSLVRALSLIAPFRSSVYRLLTRSDDQPESSIPQAMQRLFSLMQSSQTLVSTIVLTMLLGRGPKTLFTQHDIQAVNRPLQDKIEEKMKGTSEEGQVARLFRGKMVTYTKCRNVHYESMSRLCLCGVLLGCSVACGSSIERCPFIVSWLPFHAVLLVTNSTWHFNPVRMWRFANVRFELFFVETAAYACSYRILCPPPLPLTL